MSTLSTRTVTALRHAAGGRVGRVGFGEYTCAGRPMAYMLYAHLRGQGLWEPRVVSGVGVKVCPTDDGYAALGYDDLVNHRRRNNVRLIKMKVTMAQRIGLAVVAQWPWRDLDRRLHLIENGWVVGHGLDRSVPAGSFRLTESGWHALGYDLDVEARQR